MAEPMLLAVILIPLITAGLCLLLGGNRKVAITPIVITACVLMSAAAVYLCTEFLNGKGVIKLENLPETINYAMMAIDAIVLGATLYWGIKLKKLLIIMFAGLQAVGAIYLEFILKPIETEVAIYMDYLSVIMLLLSAVVGSLVAIYAIGYMKEHEHHLHLPKTRQHIFFAVIFLFLSAMNALTVVNNISWLYTVWEITTLCSFLLISHDKTYIAYNNAARALWLNSLGGTAFIIGIILLCFNHTHSLSISELLEQGKEGFRDLVPLAVTLLCLAGFTKSAQFPFQKWLLGAMVAPSPVSALLHSSTMVKAGVYLVVRLSPLFAGHILGTMVSVVGAFTFMAASAIAISQSNGKKVLAYSTIANLGLVITCVGLGNNIAMTAAILLIIYHAISKCLLFLCIGIVEQGIGSRNIEDMQGVFKKMPITTTIMVMGMISMLLPPFGVLATKWLALEISVYSPLVMLLIILGSAFTIVFWVKWIGIILTMSHKEHREAEKLPATVATSLYILLIGVFGSSIFIKELFDTFIAGQLKLLKLANGIITGAMGGLELKENAITAISGSFAGVPLFFAGFVLIAFIFWILQKAKPARIVAPYVGGELANDDIRGIEFTGPMDKVSQIEVHNYYLAGMFDEYKLSIIATVSAIAIIMVMFGVIVK